MTNFNHWFNGFNIKMVQNQQNGMVIVLTCIKWLTFWVRGNQQVSKGLLALSLSLNSLHSLRRAEKFLEDYPTIKVPSSCQELSLFKKALLPRLVVSQKSPYHKTSCVLARKYKGIFETASKRHWHFKNRKAWTHWQTIDSKLISKYYRQSAKMDLSQWFANFYKFCGFKNVQHYSLQ